MMQSSELMSGKNRKELVSNQNKNAKETKTSRIFVVRPDILKKIGLYDKIHTSNVTPTENKSVENLTHKGENNRIIKGSDEGTESNIKSKKRLSARGRKNVSNKKIDQTSVSNQDINSSEKSPRKSLRKNAGSRMKKMLKDELYTDKTVKLENTECVDDCNQLVIKNRLLETNGEVDITRLRNKINFNSECVDSNGKKVAVVSKKRHLSTTETNDFEFESKDLKNYKGVFARAKRKRKCSNLDEKKLEYSKTDSQLSDKNIYTVNTKQSLKKNKTKSCAESKPRKNAIKKNSSEQVSVISMNETVLENCDTSLTDSQKKKRGRPKKKINATCTENNNKKLETPIEVIKCENDFDCGTYPLNLNKSVKSEYIEDIKKNDEISTEVDGFQSSGNCNEVNVKVDLNASFLNKSYMPKKGRPAKRDVEDIESPDPIFYDASFLSDSPSEVSNARNKKGRSMEKSNKEKNVVKCVRCNKYLVNTEWINHNQNFHNNLGWRDGETPIDLNNECLVKCILTKLCKKRKCLRCEKCREKKLSVNGLLSHYQQCGKTEEEVSAVKVSCPVCQRVMLPLSLEIHMKVHQAPKVVKKTEEDDLVIQTKGKRDAATKALDRFKQFADEEHKQEDDNSRTGDSNLMYSVPSEIKRIPNILLSKWKIELNMTGKAKCRSQGCDFIADDITAIKEHYPKCNHSAVRAFTCKICKFIAATESEIMAHVKDHSDEESESEEEDKEGERETGSKIDPVINLKYFTSLPFKNQNEVYSYLYQQTKDYYNKNVEPLYTKQIPVWHRVDDKSKYLPSIKESMNMVSLCDETKEDISPVDLKWKKLSLFESENQDKQSVIFCGGPIWGLAWVPTTDTNDDQYLAVSCNKDLDKFHEVGRVYHEEGLIQIWNFGLLNNDSNNKLQKPKLSFGVAHNYGPIWSMEWCPRGCYQSKKTSTDFQRLGLLAVTSTDGFIYVLSIPSPEELSEDSIISVEPVFKLTFGTTESIEDFSIQPMKITWCKNGDHNLLAGGFNNGLVCIWNLQSTSSLLKTEKNNVIELLPCQLFYPHKTMITGLDFSHFDENRWLLTSALDTGSKIWDLEDLFTPVSISKKATATAAIWCAHWNCYCVCYDNSCLQLGSGSTLTSVREWGFKTIHFFGSNSAVGCLSQNMWVNGIVQCSSLGETQVIFPSQLFFGVDSDQVAKRKSWIIGHTEYVNCTPNSNTENLSAESKKTDADSKESSKNHDKPPQTYSDLKDKFGIVFKDYKLDSSSNVSEKNQKITMNIENKSLLSFGAYPLEAINRVSWNPNPQSHRFLAFGYQAGFLRIRCIERADNKIGIW